MPTPASVLALVGKQWDVVLPPATGIERTTLFAFDWATLGKEAVQDVAEYFVPAEVEPFVERGEWLPFAVLGIGHAPSGFTEMGNDGALFVELRDGADGRVFWAREDRQAIIAENVAGLRLEPIARPTAHATPRYREPPFRERWDVFEKKRMEKDYDGALAIVDALAPELPEEPQIHFARASLLASLRRKDEARAALDAAVGAAGATVADHVIKSSFLMRWRRYDEVVAVLAPLDDTSLDDPDKAERHALQGVALVQLGRESEGLAAMQRSAALDASVIDDNREWSRLFEKLSAGK